MTTVFTAEQMAYMDGRYGRSERVTESADVHWLMYSGVLVFLMQAGFAMLCAGFRAVSVHLRGSRGASLTASPGLGPGPGVVGRPALDRASPRSLGEVGRRSRRKEPWCHAQVGAGEKRAEHHAEEPGGRVRGRAVVLGHGIRVRVRIERARTPA